MAEAHHDPRFTNAATYQLAVTFTIAGGARQRTAHRRASKVAERIVNAAARAAEVVDVHAEVGPVGIDDQVVATTPVRFSAANTGRGTYAEPKKLSRYLDPDHERALVSLSEAERAYRQRRDADRDRRRQVGCTNAVRALWTTTMPPGLCGCVYCDPELHRLAVDEPDDTAGELPRCVCGRVASSCRDHDDVLLVVFDGDPTSLHELASRRASRRDGGRP